MNKYLEIFWRFLALGCVSFGGPAAHIGYFQKTFVQNLKWIDANSYAKLIALSQFLPGPGSSQIGFALGLKRGGLLGGIAAFAGFTLPSFILMVWLATSLSSHQDSTLFEAAVQGLKLLAVVVVADATLTMFKNFCKNDALIAVAVVSAVFLLMLPGLFSQMFVLIAAAMVGWVFMQPAIEQSHIPTERVYTPPLKLFALAFIALPIIAWLIPTFSLISDFYQAGSLVFGGGHVVLPLLQESVGTSLSQDQFLTGYAAAQGVPGPMFTMATYLGAVLTPTSPLTGATLATLAIFIPGFLLVYGLHDSWDRLAENPSLAGAVSGINAAVVGLLFSALYQPVFTSAVVGAVEMGLIVVGFYLLRVVKVPIVFLVAGFVLVGNLI